LLDAKTKTVKAATVNLRAGPGRNYSELGKLNQGASITIVRSLEDWTQIEPPTGTFAYVASSLVDTTPQPSAIKQEKPAETAPAPVASTKPAPPIPTKTLTEPAAEPKPIETAPAPTETKVAEAPQLKPAAADPVATAAPAPVPTPAPVVPAPVVTAPALTPATPIATSTPAPSPVPPAEVKPRHVIRDGIVSGAVSVQAPGYYELRSLHAEGVVDYLVSDNPDLNLAKFHGKAVTVSGEEWRDVRWKTPVLKVKSIESAF
jgi:hypothetical protein